MSDTKAIVHLTSDQLGFLAVASIKYIDFLFDHGYLDDDDPLAEQRGEEIREIGLILQDAAESIAPIDVYEVAPYEIVPTGTYL